MHLRNSIFDPAAEPELDRLADEAVQHPDVQATPPGTQARLHAVKKYITKQNLMLGMMVYAWAATLRQAAGLS